MRTDIPAQLLARFRQSETSMAMLWVIEKNDGTLIRGTEHDRDIELPAVGSSPADKYAGVYKAIANITLGNVTNNTDMSVGNLEVQGAVSKNADDQSPTRATRIDVSISDIESGLLDRASVKVLICDWQFPEYGYFIYKSGFLGTISNDSDGAYTTEVRGLTQLLAQTVIRTFSNTCNVVKFGDVRCKKDLAPLTHTGVVGTNSAGNNRISFAVEIDAGASGVSPTEAVYTYRGGTLAFTTGANATFFRELKIDPNDNGGVALFWEQFPNDVNAGDEFTIVAGCPRTREACIAYGNLINNRAYGIFIPGVNALTEGPVTKEQLG